MGPYKIMVFNLLGRNQDTMINAFSLRFVYVSFNCQQINNILQKEMYSHFQRPCSDTLSKILNLLHKFLPHYWKAWKLQSVQVEKMTTLI